MLSARAVLTITIVTILTVSCSQQKDPKVRVDNLSAVEFLAVKLCDTCWQVIGPGNSKTFSPPVRSECILISFTRFDDPRLYSEAEYYSCNDLDLRPLGSANIKNFHFTTDYGSASLLEDRDQNITILARPISPETSAMTGAATASNLDGASSALAEGQDPSLAEPRADRGIQNIEFTLQGG